LNAIAVGHLHTLAQRRGLLGVCDDNDRLGRPADPPEFGAGATEVRPLNSFAGSRGS
jgi:hypothetical protein